MALVHHRSSLIIEVGNAGDIEIHGVRSEMRHADFELVDELKLCRCSRHPVRHVPFAKLLGVQDFLMQSLVESLIQSWIQSKLETGFDLAKVQGKMVGADAEKKMVVHFLMVIK